MGHAYNLKSWIFNIFEMMLIIATGLLINRPLHYVILAVAIFILTRRLAGGGKHYKNLLLCMFWSWAVMTSIFLIIKTDIILTIGSSIFAGIVLSQKGDIDEWFMMAWKNPNEYKHDYIKQFVVNNLNNRKLQIFESLLKEENPLAYEIYQLRFYEDIALDKVAKRVGLKSRQRVLEALDSIMLTLKVFEKMYEKLEEELTKS